MEDFPQARSILNAALNKMLRGDDVAESVADCENIFRWAAEISDKTAMHARERGNTEMLVSQASHEDLRHVGHYRGNVRHDKRKIVREYEKRGVRIQFVFKEGEFDFTHALKANTARGDRVSEKEMQLHSRMMIAEAVSGKRVRTYRQNALINARDLSGYVLERVDIVRRGEGLFGGIFKNRECVYKRAI